MGKQGHVPGYIRRLCVLTASVLVFYCLPSTDTIRDPSCLGPLSLLFPTFSLQLRAPNPSMSELFTLCPSLSCDLLTSLPGFNGRKQGVAGKRSYQDALEKHVPGALATTIAVPFIVGQLATCWWVLGLGRGLSSPIQLSLSKIMCRI